MHPLFGQFRRRFDALSQQITQHFVPQFMRFKAREHLFMVVVAILIGLVAGYGAVGIQMAIKLFQKLFWGEWHLSLDHLSQLHWLHKLLIPALGGFLVGLIVQYVAVEAKGSGVPEVMEAVALRNGFIRPRVVVAKLLAASIYIGAGGSVGREGPVIQIGSSIGSTIGRFLRVRAQHVKTFVACGAAAGIAAAFNAPIAGALYSVEVILGDYGVSKFSPIVISSVVATVVSRAILGDYPAFQVPPFEFVSYVELLPYAGLGILAGLIAVLFVQVMDQVSLFFDKYTLPAYWKAAIGGLSIGALGLLFPYIYGVGYEVIDRALRGEMLWGWLLALIFLKMIATSISLGSGGSGGVFAPSLFLGAMAGGFYGHVLHELFPGTTAHSGAYAIIGMGAVVAATTHAPISAILMLFELTNEYEILMPTMLCSIIATLVKTRLKKESIYTIKLVRRGVDLFKGRDLNVLRALTIRDVMQKGIRTVPQNLPLNSLLKEVLDRPDQLLAVVDEAGDYRGVVTFRQARQALQEQELLAHLVVAEDVVDPGVVAISADERLDNVMKIFGQQNLDVLPVVASHEAKTVVGQVSRRDVIAAYNQEIAKHDVTSEIAQSSRLLDQAKSLNFIEGYTLAEIACPRPFAGKSLRQLNLKSRFNIQVILVRRRDSGNRETSFVPHASEVLQRGDIIVIVGPSRRVQRIRNW